MKAAGPLDGLLVVDLTRVLAGPFCTMLMADMGAEVIKVERPGGGDDSRSFGPFLNGESAYFMSINRGKKSVTLNLKHPQGKALLLKLVEGADVLVENFKPGVMNKLGLGYQELQKVNPRLIMAASSGFGQDGPYSARPAYDLIIQGMSGMMSITGPDGGPPTKVGSSIADILAGVFTCVGVLAALQSRERTGKGQMVDVAMLDCMVAVLENALARYIATDENPIPIGNRHPSIAPFATLRTADNPVNVACGNDLLWCKLCQVVELPSLIQDPRFLTNQDRVANWCELETLLREAMSKKSAAHWLTALGDAGVPCGPILQVDQVLSDPQVVARKMVRELVHPVAGALRMPGVPIKFSDTPAEVDLPAPTLGQHNREIFMARLGLSDEQLAHLTADGAI